MLIVAPVGIVVVNGLVTWTCLHKQFTSHSKLNFGGIGIQLIMFSSFVLLILNIQIVLSPHLTTNKQCELRGH